MIILTETKEEKSQKTSVAKSLISKSEYDKITCDDTLKWFRRLGGSETAHRTYTSQGYNVYRLISRSPNRLSKSVREFDFVDFPSYKAEQIFNNLFQSMDELGRFKLKRFKRLLTISEVKKVIKRKL
ncbi:MAG: Cdc6-like AAA superfamily ATPase [Parvicella sp.]|jgi:Cdc6-like AAA superfamily ATPase